MEINNNACEISFELVQPIEIRGEGGQAVQAQTVKFRQPNRQSAGIFFNLLSKFNNAITATVMKMQELADPEELEEARRVQATKAKSNEAQEIIKTLENITVEDLEKEIEGKISLMNEMDFDFEKAYKLFDRLLLSGDRRYPVCLIGGMLATDGMLEKIHYQDVQKMLAVYLCFFGLPAKSGQKIDSEMRSDLDMQARDA